MQAGGPATPYGRTLETMGLRPEKPQCITFHSPAQHRRPGTGMRRLGALPITYKESSTFLASAASLGSSFPEIARFSSTFASEAFPVFW